MFIFRTPRVFFCHRQWLMNFACCQRLHIGRCILQKKKWTKDEISSLLAWDYATNVICGPRIEPKKAGSTASRVNHEAVHSDHCYVNTSEVAIGITADELTNSVAQMADLPCSVSRRISAQTVFDEELVEKRRPLATDSYKTTSAVTEKRQTEANNSNSLSKHNSEEGFLDSTKRKDTYGYTWVDGFSRPLPDKTSGTEQNSVVSYSQSTDIGANNVQNVEHVSHHMSSVRNASIDSVKISHSDREQSTDNIAPTELQTDEDKVLKSSFAQYILSFPLFTSSVLAVEAVGLSARLPSVSAILKATMPPESQLALTRWEQRMIAELGEDGFKEYKKALFANGSNLHNAIHQYLSGKPEEELVLLSANHGHWQSIQSVLADITDVVCLEKPVRHQHLKYCGILDCIAEYRGEKHVIEWKTSKRRKSNIQETFDNPLQLVAYLGAYNVQPSTSLQVERCLLVIGYEDGSDADIHVMDKWDCLRYWSTWLHRLHLYRADSL